MLRGSFRVSTDRVHNRLELPGALYVQGSPNVSSSWHCPSFVHLFALIIAHRSLFTLNEERENNTYFVLYLQICCLFFPLLFFSFLSFRSLLSALFIIILKQKNKIIPKTLVIPNKLCALPKLTRTIGRHISIRYSLFIVPPWAWRSPLPLGLLHSSHPSAYHYPNSTRPP